MGTKVSFSGIPSSWSDPWKWEELLVEMNNKAMTKATPREPYKSSFKYPSASKGILGPVLEDTKNLEEKPKWEDRYDSLKAIGRARGECFMCGENFRPDHRCPKAMQIYVLDELLDVLQVTTARRAHC